MKHHRCRRYASGHERSKGGWKSCCDVGGSGEVRGVRTGWLGGGIDASGEGMLEPAHMAGLGWVGVALWGGWSGVLCRKAAGVWLAVCDV